MSRPIRLSLPSKGRLSEEAINFLAACGFSIYKPNPRQYEASLPALPGLTVLFQRPTDIVLSVRDGSVDFGISGLDVLSEHGGPNGAILAIHSALGFGSCSLNVIVPESWETVRVMNDLKRMQAEIGRPLRVATKFPNAAAPFFAKKGLGGVIFIEAEGTLEIAPTIGYADLIADLVSSGQTLRDNRLKLLADGQILASQAVLIANRAALKENPAVLAIARQLLEFIEAYQRAQNNVSIFANLRGESQQALAASIFSQNTIGGLNGPTLSNIIRKDNQPNWYALHIVVHREQLSAAINELRAIGGSGVVVAPVTYIFEEEPPRYKAMLEALK
ncbi:MAG: ATP phosphoribosyltransferase [Anaerolineales bacterium]|jgi:ATP phosphoribosyltransferase|nr:ATP phosphoribosyltransferase [Anaerolineales bacterium]